MSLNIGDITASSGLAKRIFDNWIANASACGFGASPSAGAQTMLQAQAYCLAKAIVEEIQANAQITAGACSVTIGTGTGGLQRVSGADTDPPSTTKFLSGSVTGQIL